MYREYLNQPLTLDMKYHQSKKKRKLPIVLTPDEVSRLFEHIPQSYLLPFQLMYGSGLRLMEAARLRVKNIDFDYGAVRVWNGKGGKNRVVTLAQELHEPLAHQITVVRRIHVDDRRSPLSRIMPKLK